jgi:2'-5' RNA ligase
MIRLFAALETPPEIADGLVRRQQGVPGARWRPVDALHVTLCYFGELSEDVAGELDAELARVEAEPFDLALEGVGAFGEGHQLRAVWAGVRDSEPLRRLAIRCEAAGRRVGVKGEARAFRPHVTLAYLGREAAQDRVAAWVASNNLLVSPSWRVTWFGLYSSLRSPKGSRYDLEREYSLL